ncbi:hypothetical protein J8J40_31590, partial [Mycobacterium tuberculosis]|nr:hypothetical protein [Mycobacterium tuberculosis]
MSLDNRGAPCASPGRPKTAGRAPRGRPVFDRKNAMHRYRSHTCGQLTANEVGQTVRLSGWV